MSRKDRLTAMEALSPHAAGNHQALVSEETHDRGMLTRPARAARDSTDPGPGQLVRSTGKKTGFGICRRHRLPHLPPRRPGAPSGRAVPAVAVRASDCNSAQQLQRTGTGSNCAA